jgi:hypothetical protein
MIELYLGMQELAGGMGGRFVTSSLPSLHERLDAVLNECLGGGSRWRQAATRVWLSGGLADVFLIERVAGLKSWSEAEALASAGGSGQGQEIALDAFPGESDALVLAADGQMLDAVRAGLQRRRVRVTSMQPWWAAELAGSGAGENDRPELLVATDEGAATLVVGDGSRHLAAACHRPCPSQSSLQATVQRTALVHGVGPGAIRHVHGGAGWLKARIERGLARAGAYA